jgi:hypothetical protein
MCDPRDMVKAKLLQVQLPGGQGASRWKTSDHQRALCR